jgi:hypothetical protein
MIRLFVALSLFVIPLLQIKSPQVQSNGSSLIYQGSAVDVDHGSFVVINDSNDPSTLTYIESFEGSDFWFENSGKRRYFHPQHGAQFALRTTSKTDMSCGPGASLTYSKAQIRIDDIPFGSPICILTDEGRRGEIRIRAFDPKTTGLTLEWTTWEK